MTCPRTWETRWKSHGEVQIDGRKDCACFNYSSNLVAHLPLNALSAEVAQSPLTVNGNTPPHCQSVYISTEQLSLITTSTTHHCPPRALHSIHHDIFPVLKVPKYIFHLGPLRDTGLTPRSSYSFRNGITH